MTYLSVAENLALLYNDPFGTRQRELAELIVSIPARRRAIAGMKSALVAARTSISVMELQTTQRKNAAINAARNAIRSYENKLNELENLARSAWEIGSNRGAISGHMPTVTIVEPDNGLGGWVETLAITLIAATVVAAIVFSAAVTVPVAIALAIMGAVAALAISASSTTASLAEFSSNPGSGVIAASGAAGLVAVAAIAFLFLSSRKRK